MKKLFSKNLLGLAGMSLLVFSAQSALALVPNNVAVISNSGSTNTIGYRIYVSPSGEAHYVDGKGSGKSKLSTKLTKKFFHDLKVAEPLSTLPTQTCAKSTSFGTTTTVSLGGQQSPDVSCPGNKNAKAENLDHDVITIAKILRVVNVPKSQGKPLPPQNF